MRLYHGSQNLFDRFETRKKATITSEVADVPIFVTEQKEFAKLHASPNGYIYTLDVDLGKVFEGNRFYRESKYWPPAPEDLTKEGEQLWQDIFSGNVFGQVEDEEEVDDYLASVLKHNWDAIEHPGFLRWMKKHDYDSACIRGEHTGNHYAVFDPRKIEIVSVEPLHNLKGKLLR